MIASIKSILKCFVLHAFTQLFSLIKYANVCGGIGLYGQAIHNFVIVGFPFNSTASAL
jgi:hypothetical protein